MYTLNDNNYNFDLDTIEIRPINKISNNFLKVPIKINIKGKKKPFLFQTPKMFIPFGINKNDNYNNIYLDISFRDKEYNPDVKKFFLFLKKIRSKIKQLLISEKIIKRTKNNPEFIDSIKKDNYGERLTTKFNNVDGNYSINIYDNKKNKKKIEDIKKGIYTILIINLSDIWIVLDENSKPLQYGFTWLVMQMKIYEPLNLKDYCFIESSDDEEIITEEKKTEIKEEDKIKNHKDYKIYFNMLRYRIPLENIKYKMKSNNLNTDIIDLDPDSKIPDNLLVQNISNDISNLIINGKELKKAEILKKKVQNKEKDNVPSLDDILGSIKSLRKTNYDNKYMSGIFYDKDQYLSNEKIKGLRKEINNLENSTKEKKTPMFNPMQELFSEINNLENSTKENKILIANPMQSLFSEINSLRKD
jgi:hypothetical protein